MSTPPSRRTDERRTESRRGLLKPVWDILYSLIRWAGRHAIGFYSAVGLFLVLGLAIAVTAAALFGLIALGMGAGATQQFDDAVVSWLRRRTHPILDALALAGAALGSGVAMWIVLIVGTVLFWRSRHHYSALLLWAALLGGRVLNAELKALFDRPRPEPVDWDLAVFGRDIPFPASTSFPSGHAVMAVVIFGTLAYLTARLEPTPGLRRMTLATAAALILLIGLSRIYLGVHYPSDVVAGLLAGLAWATFAALGIEALRYFIGRRPEAAAEERDLDRGIAPVREALRSER